MIVWADDTTEFYGQISARGGKNTGDGGFAEVSGKKYLLITGHADLRSVSGNDGALLLDPGSVSIVDGTAAPADPPSRNSITDGWIETQLGSGHLEITTADATGGDADITVASGVSISWTTNKTLTLTAGQDINLDGTYSATHNGGALVLQIGQDNSGGTLTVSNTADVSAVTGGVTVTGVRVQIPSRVQLVPMPSLSVVPTPVVLRA